jgi:hypothetical protein
MFKFENSHDFILTLVRVTGPVRGQYFFKGVAIYKDDSGAKKVRKIGVRFNPFNKAYYVNKYTTLRSKIDEKDARVKQIETLAKSLISEHSNKPISDSNFHKIIVNTLNLALGGEVEAVHAEAIPKERIDEIIGNIKGMVSGNAPLKFDTKKKAPYYSDSGMGQYWLEDLGEAKKGVDYK